MSKFVSFLLFYFCNLTRKEIVVDIRFFFQFHVVLAKSNSHQFALKTIFSASIDYWYHFATQQVRGGVQVVYVADGKRYECNNFLSKILKEFANTF